MARRTTARRRAGRTDAGAAWISYSDMDETPSSDRYEAEEPAEEPVEEEPAAEEEADEDTDSLDVDFNLDDDDLDDFNMVPPSPT